MLQAVCCSSYYYIFKKSNNGNPSLNDLCLFVCIGLSIGMLWQEEGRKNSEGQGMCTTEDMKD